MPEEAPLRHANINTFTQPQGPEPPGSESKVRLCDRPHTAVLTKKTLLVQPFSPTVCLSYGHGHLMSLATQTFIMTLSTEMNRQPWGH